MEFYCYETREMIKAKHRPLVFITSNNEKELPDAFLRRCFFHYIKFPEAETMKRIVTSIEQVSTMVAEISRATAEQADDIQGVNRAVSDMDKNTQQNAALVEESAAAAESLRVQAEGLVRTISVFQVD